MKKSAILKLFSLVAFAAAGVFAVGAAKSSRKAEPVKADPVTYSGSIIVEKAEGDARWDGCYLASYLFDDNSHNTWGPKIANTNSKYQVYSWSGLSFEPTKIILLRVPSNWDSDWQDPWWSGEGGIYERTGNVTLSSTDVVWINGSATESSGWTAYSTSAVVMGYDKDDGGSQILNAPLSEIKINSNDVLECYGEVTLAANTYFKVVKGGVIWSNSYTAHSSVASNFSLVEGGNENIHNTAAGTYEFYFKYNDAQLYITDPVLAAADDWAQNFLGANCTATKANWTARGTEFAALNSGAKTLLAGQAHIDYKSEATTLIEQAVQRYDYVIELYGIEGEGSFADFMGRVEAGKVVPKSAAPAISYNTPSSNNLIVIVSIVSLISASTLVGLIVIKRRRGIAK